MEAYAYDRDPSLLTAFKIVVQRMQRKTQELAYHAIAHPLDWSDRAKVWAGAGLPSFSAAQPWPGARMKCSFEPGGCLVDYMEIEAEQARKEVA
ncbi:MAG TPA: hypothetical protein VG167_14915 [Verrucomicrobiae bacterium]|nr:hypothetical protein [Verrucomicrobiae bacterium]